MIFRSKHISQEWRRITVYVLTGWVDQLLSDMVATWATMSAYYDEKHVCHHNMHNQLFKQSDFFWNANASSILEPSNSLRVMIWPHRS